MAAVGSAGSVLPWVRARLPPRLCSAPLGVAFSSFQFQPCSSPLSSGIQAHPFPRRLHTDMDPRLQAFGKDSPAAAVKTVPAQDAHELLKAGHHYLDVRTPEEFIAGHPVGAVNVPYMFKSAVGMVKNSAFVEEVLTHFSKNDAIVIGCQSGKRSLMAATELLASDFTGIKDVGGGYSAWVQAGLPVA